MVPTRSLRPRRAAVGTPHLSRSPYPLAADPTSAANLAEEQDPLRSIAFYCGVALLFIRVSMLHQIVTQKIGVNLHILYFFTVPALLGVLIAGGIRRTLRDRISWYWIGFAVWMVLAIPFSTWIVSSIGRVAQYVRTEWLLLFVVGGLAVNWRECRALMWALAAGGMVTIANSRLFRYEDTNERIGLQFGTISNSNDFACHLLFVLPFVLWAAVCAKSHFVRLLYMGAFAFGIYVTFATASRGAAVAFVVAALYFLYKATLTQRLAAIVMLPIALLTVVVLMPSRALQRIQSLNMAADDPESEAMQSRAAREDLLLESLKYTVRRPIFGVGPGQFAAYEGITRKVIGDHGRWQETHNTYTQISSECGIPALLFYLAAIVVSFRLLSQTYRQARDRPECHDIRMTAFFASLSFISYGVAAAFLSFAYFFYMPALTGLSMVVARAAAREFQSRRSPVMVMPIRG